LSSNTYSLLIFKYINPFGWNVRWYEVKRFTTCWDPVIIGILDQDHQDDDDHTTKGVRAGVYLCLSWDLIYLVCRELIRDQLSTINSLWSTTLEPLTPSNFVIRFVEILTIFQRFLWSLTFFLMYDELLILLDDFEQILLNLISFSSMKIIEKPTNKNKF
jgi:hypothetical protein